VRQRDSEAKRNKTDIGRETERKRDSETERQRDKEAKRQ
jgi:hypothetical protein